MPKETKCYKIRDKRKPGLWKRPGYYGGFGETGKTWSSLGAVSGALALLRGTWGRDELSNEILDNWEIVEFTIQESSTKTVREYREERKKKNGKTAKQTEL